VCLGDGFDDRQSEADARVVGAYAFGAALERFGERGDHLWSEFLAGVLDRQDHGVGLCARGEPHGAAMRQVVDDRVLDEVRRHLEQERV